MNLEIPAHKVRVIIGANGCEKSTLMKTLSRLLKPEKGQVVLDGKAVYGYSSTQLAQMLGLLPPVSNGTGGNHGGRFGRTWTISIPEVHAEYDQRGLCRS